MRMLRRTTAIWAALLLMLAGAPAALAQQAADIQLDSPIRGIEIDSDRATVDLDVVLHNTATARRTVAFVLEGVPEGWDVGVWSSFFDYRITEFVVEPEAAVAPEEPEPDEQAPETSDEPARIQQVKLRVQPRQPEPGEYSFTLRVVSPDGAIEYDRATYRVAVTEGVEVQSGVVSVRSELPVLQGAPGEALGFEVEVQNGTEEEASFTLNAEPPSGWEVTFREFFGEERVIAAVNLEPELSERISVEVRVPMETPSGEYEIPVSATGGQGSAGIVLLAQVVGVGELELQPPQGQTPSAETEPGQQALATLVLLNPGTADLNDVQLRADAPEGWEVEFGHPNNTIGLLPANQQIEVPVLVTPSARAAPGDYLVTVHAAQGQAAAVMDVRMTVTQQGVWGWLGLALLVVVVGGIGGLFFRLARR